MAGASSEESVVETSTEVISSGQRCQSGELAEWRSSEQLENGFLSTSPLYWDTDDDDDGGQRPSELFGKYTWKIEKFSQINKRELRSSVFEVGGYKWYILIYPQGCDVCNHLSLFLCVANHDKLIPGWSHFAQFTIAVVNKDPKKSKYSDTLHRFWKKEHDWGWKKFMELSKVFDGFIDNDTLIIKAQVQVIREKIERPFQSLDCQYRRELVRVYLTHVEQICRRFVEERRGKLRRLIEDKAKWSSFCAFWLGIDQNARRRMSREKTDSILNVVVKHFFIEKDVTSTLVMDSLYSGLKALEGQSAMCKIGMAKLSEFEDILPAPIIRIEKDSFVLVDDVLLLLERASREPMPPKDEKGPQNRTKEGNSGDDFYKDSIVRDETRLTELGRRTVEIFVLSHIFSNKIEVAYQEAVALKMQEELIREEEASWLAENELKAKRGAEKEKKSKKKQAKQKRNNRKGKDKSKEQKASQVVFKHQDENSIVEKVEEPLPADKLDEVSDIYDSADGVTEALPLDSEDRDVNNTVNSMEDSSSTCSTDSVPSVAVINPPCNKGNPSLNQKKKNSRKRVKNQRCKITSEATNWGNDMESQPLDDISGSSRGGESEQAEAIVTPLQDKKVLQKEEILQQKKPSIKVAVDAERPVKEKMPAVPSSPPQSPSLNPLASTRIKSNHMNAATSNPNPVQKTPSYVSQEKHNKAKPDTQKAQSLKPPEKLPVLSRPLSTPLFSSPRPSAPVSSIAQTAPSLSRLVSAAGRLGPEPAPSFVPLSYRNAIIGNNPIGQSSVSLGQSLASFGQSSTSFGQSSVVNLNPSQVHSQPAPMVMVSAPMMGPGSVQSDFSFGMATRSDVLQNGSQWDSSIPAIDDVQNLDVYNMPSQTQGALADEFPHMDIITDLLDDEQGIGSGSRLLTRQFSYPGDVTLLDDHMGASSSNGSCRFEQTRSYLSDGLQQGYNRFDSMREYLPQASRLPYMSVQLVEEMIQNQNHWQRAGTDFTILGMRNT